MNDMSESSLPNREPLPCSAGRLLREWLLIGGQSFGGGSMTFILMRQTFVERTCWVPAVEFDRFFALVQIAPGINLLALAILIGKRILGWRGVLLSLFGLLLPSVFLTALITAGYARIQHTALAQATLRGFLPATVGLGILTAYQMARTNLVAAHKEGKMSLVIGLGALLGSGIAVGYFGAAVLPALFAAGVLGASEKVWGQWRAGGKPSA